MNTCFDQKVDRTGGVFWLKNALTPEAVLDAGLLGYAGAEFEFATCPAFCEGVAQAAKKGLFGYTLPYGLYRERTVWWMAQVRGAAIDPDWIVPTHGTIFSLATTIRLLTKPGEGVIMLIPGYNRYEQAARRLSRRTVMVALAEREGCYEIDFAALERAMAEEDNKLLVLCNPNNPTGQILPPEDLARIAALSKAYGVAVFCDEIFADVTLGNAAVPVYAQIAGDDALAISCTGLGKTFSLTGVNHANILIKNPALREAFIVQRDSDHYGSVDPMLCAGLIAAYTPQGYEWLLALRAYVLDNATLLISFLKENLPGTLAAVPEGTYVVWVDYEKTGLDAASLHALVEEKGLFVGDPGDEYFGRPLCRRYSLAVPREALMRSLSRLKEALDSRA